MGTHYCGEHSAIKLLIRGQIWTISRSGERERSAVRAGKHILTLCSQGVFVLLLNSSFIPTSTQSVFITFPLASPEVSLPLQKFGMK